MTEEQKTKEKLRTRAHQQANREYWRELNRKSYLKWSDEFYNKRLLESNKRHGKLRQVLWDDELTQLVVEEAHRLRKLRNQITGFEWHVDHIIPLNGKIVSGLHVWNNLQVIPKILNLTKNNKFKGE
jgi:hypothetical protein